MSVAKPSLLFYCQHSVGVGHLVRSFSLATTLTADWRVLFLNGGRLPAGIAVPAGVELIQLQPLGADEAGNLVSHDESVGVEAALERRRRQILECFERFDPRVLVIELFPFGRKKFATEVLPVLERARERGRDGPLVLCSLRDMLVSRKEQGRYDERAAQLANRYFHAVLVHADPAFVRLEDTFRPATALTVPVHYTVFVVRDRRAPVPLPRERCALVSSGGGLTGRALFAAALEAQRVLWAAEALPMTLIAGPFLPKQEWRALESAGRTLPGLTLIRSVPDVGLEMQRMSVSASRCGYNTALDILYSGVPALVVPYGEGLEDEQAKRATRLAARGLVRVLAPEHLDGRTLAAEIRALSTFRPEVARVAANGASDTAEWIARHAQATSRAPVARGT